MTAYKLYKGFTDFFKGRPAVLFEGNLLAFSGMEDDADGLGLRLAGNLAGWGRCEPVERPRMVFHSVARLDPESVAVGLKVAILFNRPDSRDGFKSRRRGRRYAPGELRKGGYRHPGAQKEAPGSSGREQKGSHAEA